MVRPQPMTMRPTTIERDGSVLIRKGYEEEETVEQQLQKTVARLSTPLLVSLVFHMLLMIVLGLWAISQSRRTNIEIMASNEIGSQLDTETLVNDVQQELAITNLNLPAVQNPFSAPPQFNVTLDPNSNDVTSRIMTPMLGVALTGREEGMRRSLARKFGATVESESAVDKGLEWLRLRQDKTRGNWSLQGHDRVENAELVANENREAATAMALIAFQGAGHTHRRGKYSEAVGKGIRYLIAQQYSDGNFCPNLPQSEAMYTHAMATMAICELYGMTADSQLKSPAQKAVQYIIDTQDTELGGWRYRPKFDADTSVTGWAFMALQSAKMTGMQVPDEVLQRVAKYLDSATKAEQIKLRNRTQPVQLEAGVVYAYMPGQNPDNVMTAVAMLMRQYLGWAQDDPRMLQAAELLTQPEYMPNWAERDVYYWYYASQVLHHLDGEHWKKWNDTQRDLLVSNQMSDGSWNPLGEKNNPTNGGDAWAIRRQGGRLYVTCYSLYTLEVYYRHLPIYSELKRQLEQAAKQRADGN